MQNVVVARSALDKSNFDSNMSVECQERLESLARRPF
jgi:hypothetical protein